jgi:hypothetical protein
VDKPGAEQPRKTRYRNNALDDRNEHTLMRPHYPVALPFKPGKRRRAPRHPAVCAYGEHYLARSAQANHRLCQAKQAHILVLLNKYAAAIRPLRSGLVVAAANLSAPLVIFQLTSTLVLRSVGLCAQGVAARRSEGIGEAETLQVERAENFPYR